MQPTDLDPSLAFTALIELDPQARTRNADAGEHVRKELLDDYYAQETIRNLWDFTRQWLKLRQAGRLGEAAGTAAAQWVFDGSTSKDIYQAVLRMLDDNDPAIDGLVRIQPPALGDGEDYADLAAQLGIPEDDLNVRCGEEWNERADEAFWHEIERVAREYLRQETQEETSGQ